MGTCLFISSFRSCCSLYVLEFIVGTRESVLAVPECKMYAHGPEMTSCQRGSCAIRVQCKWNAFVQRIERRLERLSMSLLWLLLRTSERCANAILIRAGQKQKINKQIGTSARWAKKRILTFVLRECVQRELIRKCEPCALDTMAGKVPRLTPYAIAYALRTP